MAHASEEFREPGRTVPRAMILGCLLVAALYLVVNFIFVANLAPADASVVFDYGTRQVTLAHALVTRLVGPGLGAVMSLFTVVILLSATSAMLYAGPRVYAAMARDGYLPRPKVGARPVTAKRLVAPQAVPERLPEPETSAPEEDNGGEEGGVPGGVAGGSGDGVVGGVPGGGGSAEIMPARPADLAMVHERIARTLVYPPRARRMGWEGHVVVAFLLLAEGEIRDLRVARTSATPSWTTPRSWRWRGRRPSRRRAWPSAWSCPWASGCTESAWVETPHMAQERV